MNKDFKFRYFQLVARLMMYLFPLIANATNLIDGLDYNYGNGKNFCELVAGYTHKGDELDHFTYLTEPS